LIDLGVFIDALVWWWTKWPRRRYI